MGEQGDFIGVPAFVYVGTSERNPAQRNAQGGKKSLLYLFQPQTCIVAKMSGLPRIPDSACKLQSEMRLAARTPTCLVGRLDDKTPHENLDGAW